MVFFYTTTNGTNIPIILNRILNIFICLGLPVRYVTRQSSPDRFLKGGPIKRISKCESIPATHEVFFQLLLYTHDLFRLVNKYGLANIPLTPDHDLLFYRF